MVQAVKWHKVTVGTLTEKTLYKAIKGLGPWLPRKAVSPQQVLRLILGCFMKVTVTVKQTMQHEMR